MALQRHLTVLQINDTHGYLEPHPELVWDGAEARYPVLGGYARIASLFAAVRKERPSAVICLDNGDTIHGTFPAVHSKGMAFVPPLNALGLDGMTAHWEFAYGPEQFKSVASALNYPMLAVNCYERESGRRPYSPYRVIERAGIRVGIVGIAATIIDKTMPPHFSTGLRFTLGREELPETIAALRERERVDLVIVLSHLGFPQDVKLASEVPGIDVYLSGHTHNRLYEPVVVNGAIMIQSGSHGSFVGRLDLVIESRRIASYSHRLIAVDERWPEDGETAQRVNDAMRPHRHMLAAALGATDTALHRYTMLEAPMDTFLLQAATGATGTTIGFSNGWRYGAPIPPGPVTMNDLWNIVPTNPRLTMVDLTGEEMHELMENNLERTFAADPYRQMGGYAKRCAGVNVYVKIENPAGKRIQQFFAEGRPLDRSRTYTVTSLTPQAVPLDVGRNRRTLGITAVDALERHLSTLRKPLCIEETRSVVAT